MFWAAVIIIQGFFSRLSGTGRIGIAAEWLHSLAYGVAAGWACASIGAGLFISLIVTVISIVISYSGMQSATWMFLRWETHADPNTGRSSTLKFIVDKIASLFGYSLGQEGYAWVAAMVKGFIIGLPVGGFLTAALWALGYEAGSHAKGRVEKFGFSDPHAFSEFLSGVGGGISILIFIKIIGSI